MLVVSKTYNISPGLPFNKPVFTFIRVEVKAKRRVHIAWKYKQKDDYVDDDDDNDDDDDIKDNDDDYYKLMHLMWLIVSRQFSVLMTNVHVNFVMCSRACLTYRR